MSVFIVCYSLLLLFWCKYKIQRTDLGLLIDHNVKEIKKLRNKFMEEDALSAAVQREQMHRGEALDPWMQARPVMLNDLEVM